MTDRKPLFETSETPEDVATLYSWANLHGAKYRDFSASRAQTREKARQRVEEAMEAERCRVRDEAEAQRVAEALQAAEAERQAESAARENAVIAQQKAAEEAARTAQQARMSWQPGPAPASYPQASAPHVTGAAPYVAPSAPYAPPAVPYPQSGAPSAAPAYSQAPGYGTPSVPLSYYAPQNPAARQYPSYTQRQAYGAPVSQTGLAPREDSSAQNRNPWAPADPRDIAGRPAWLSERPDLAPASFPQTPDDTLQGSRDRLTSRWFALKGVFSGVTPAAADPAPAQAPAQVPALAVFSLAGGVGKTSLIATLGRALSSRGERVLLVDTAAYGLLPFFFGARDQRPGVLRTFSPPAVTGDAPIQMLTMDTENLGPDNAPQEPLSSEIALQSHGANRILIDLATASGATTRRVLHLAPTVLVPVVPDMSSVVSVSSIDAFFRHNSGVSGQPTMPYYILNQFDPSLPLHLDVREVLREQLGDRLLPFALRRTPAISEALAEGMTVMDYAPNSTVAEDYGTLAGWVKSLAAPAGNGFRGVRWSER